MSEWILFVKTFEDVLETIIQNNTVLLHSRDLCIFIHMQHVTGYWNRSIQESQIIK